MQDKHVLSINEDDYFLELARQDMESNEFDLSPEWEEDYYGMGKQREDEHRPEVPG